MAKVVVISDVHGSHNWESIVSEYLYDDSIQFVFMGDYVDSWENQWPDQGENFQKICQFKREHPERVHLNWGNHDWAYITGTGNGKYTSGHQQNKKEITNLLRANYDILNIATEIDGVVFSHAGFSKYWVEHELFPQLHMIYDKWPDDETGEKGSVWDEKEFSIKLLNDTLHNFSNFHRTGENWSFSFDDILDWHGMFSGSGDEVMQGPLWIRPDALMKEPYFPKQVVGHTEFCIDKFFNFKKDENMVILTDSKEHNIFEVIDTEDFENREWLTMSEIEKYYKTALFIVNNVKSRKVKDIKSELEKEMKKTKQTFNIDKLYEWGWGTNEEKHKKHLEHTKV